MSSSDLSKIVDDIRDELTTISALRDETLQVSRLLIRSCAHCIRAIHRHEWDEAEKLLAEARTQAEEMLSPIEQFPMLYYTGYTQDALKELVEASLVYAVVKKTAVPTPQALGVAGPTYLKGMSEAATEMRRFVLDLMRRNQIADAEPYLDFMDEVYTLLITVDFPDAVTMGLRRQTDVLRNVLERTRGDLTLGLRQDQMRNALERVETLLDAAGHP